MVSHSSDLSSRSFEDLLVQANTRFSLTFEPLTIGGAKLHIPQLADMEGYLEALAETASKDRPLELPFWARIWPTSIPLSHYLQRLTPSDGDIMLEIGAGVGICGLFAAKQGFQVIISDFDENAVLLSQIAIHKNDLAHRAKAQQIDFTKDRLPHKFRYIIGSEVLYVENTYGPLVEFLKAHLDPDPRSEIILVKEYSRQADGFLSMAQAFFSIQTMTIGMRTSPSRETQDQERHLCQILRLKPKTPCSN